MKKVFSFCLIIITVIESCAQSQIFDLATFTPPKAWKKQTTESAVQFTKEDAAKGTYCIITLMKAIPATADAKENFDAAWETVVKEMVKVSTAPEIQPSSKEDGWEAQSGYAPFESDGSKGVALLVTSTGYQKMVNILILTNTDVYESEMTAFLESVSFKKPSAEKEQESKTEQSKPVTKQDGFAFSTTNFDDGWTSVIQNDWVLVSKGNIKVYLFYALSFNATDFTGTGLRQRDFYWDKYVAKYFDVQTKQYKDDGEVIGSFQPHYVEGWAKDKQTGEKIFIGMRLDISPNTAYITIGSAPDEASFHQQFPKANGGSFSASDLSDMSRYNKFTIGANDILGTWKDGNTSTAQWYYTTPSGYEGYAGMTLAATSSVFNFNTNGNYTSIHNGATGAVGNMSTFQQNYKGKFTVTNWTITATNRFEGKTEVFNAWFEVVRGGRILHLQNKQYASQHESLVKTK